MKQAIFSTVAVVLVAAHTAAATTKYLSWEFSSTTPTFSDLGSQYGENYQRCSWDSVAVGLTANGSNIQTISLTCGNIVPSDASFPVTPISGTVPVQNFITTPGQVVSMGRWLGGGNGPYNTCPDGEMMLGASCTGNDCTNMGIYCAPIWSGDSGRKVYTPHMTPEDGDPISYLTREKCGWSGIVNSGESMTCPPFKVLAGLRCWGKRCSHLTLYCCPVIEEYSERN